MTVFRRFFTRGAVAALSVSCAAGPICAQEVQSLPEEGCSDCGTLGATDTDGRTLGEIDRVSKHRQAIEYYWEQMGIKLPQDRARSAKAINEMSKDEFQHLLDGIEMIGGPTSQPL